MSMLMDSQFNSRLSSRVLTVIEEIKEGPFLHNEGFFTCIDTDFELLHVKLPSGMFIVADQGEMARTTDTADIPISGIGGTTDWRDAVDHLAIGAQNVQICTAAMVYGKMAGLR